MPSPRTTRRAGRPRSITLFYVLTVLDNLTFTLPIWVLFGTEFLGLSYVQSIVVQSVPFYLVAGLLQVPGGAWADRYGRKRAYILGTLLTVGGWAPFLLTHDFWVLCLTILPVGLGQALRSGSVEAIASSACDEHPDYDFHHVMSHGWSLINVARLLGSPIGGLLYTVDPRLPISANGIGFLIGAVLATRLDEVRSSSGASATNLDVDHAPADRWSASDYIRQSVATFRQHPDIWKMLGLIGSIGFAGSLSWVVYQPALDAVGLNPAWLGVVFAGMSAAGAIGAQAYRKWGAGWTPFTVLLAAMVGCTITDGAFLLLHSWPVAFFTLAVALATGGWIPVANTYISARTPSHLRATALSFVTFFWHSGMVLAWLVTSAVLASHATSAAFGLAVAADVAVLLLIVGLAPRHRTDPGTTAATEAEVEARTQEPAVAQR